ncbi:MAG: hypothetical protein AAFQ37_08160 [Bacteroidota bacterium]
MPQKYNIRFNRPEPSSEEVNKHRNFDDLLNRYHGETDKSHPTTRVMPMRSRRYLTYVIGAAAAIALLLIAYRGFQDAKQQKNANGVFVEDATQDPASLLPPLASFEIADPANDQNISLMDGEMVISRTTLFRDRGRSIERPILIHYRQINEEVQAKLPGLLLDHVNTNTTLPNLDAAAVLEVFATAGGQPISMAPEALVPVELNAQIATSDLGHLTDYQLYRFDSLSQRWIAFGTIEAEAIDPGWPADWGVAQQYRNVEQDFAQRIADAQFDTPLPPRPTPPQREIGDNPTLELDFLNELALAEGSDVNQSDLERLNQRGIWEILPETAAINENAFNVIWEQVRLRRLQNDRYEMTLINPQKQERLIVRPILLDDGNYREAMYRYEVALATYNNILEGQQVAKAAIARLQAEREAALHQATLEVQDFIDAMPKAEQQRWKNRTATFRFSI